MNDRIRLAEAMGFVMASSYKDGPNLDPFTDANDDYAVLLHYRKHPDPRIRTKFFRALANVQSRRDLHEDDAGYELGDYARAALKVIDND